MGGRVASLIAQDLSAAGLLCFGYPFHPQKKPDSLRTGHLADLTVPTLICQGTRDPFGTQEEVAGYALSPATRLHWLADGDHDFIPRRSATGKMQADLITEAAEAAARWWDDRAS